MRHRTAHQAFVSKVISDAITGKNDQTCRHDRKYFIVAAERGGLGVFRPVRFEADLCDLARLGPAGGDTPDTLGRSAMQKHHVGVFSVGTVEFGLDPFMIVEIYPTSKSDLGTGRDEQFGLGALASGQEIAAIDHRRGHMGVADLRACARPP